MNEYENMTGLREDAKAFLRDKGMLDADKNEFIIQYDDGRKFNLVELLSEFGDEQFRRGLCADNEDE